MNGKNGINPGLLTSVPIIGRKLDDRGIALVKDVLAKLEKGELLNVAIVGEAANGDMIMSHSMGLGQPIKLRGALSTLGTALDLGIIGVHRG